MRRFCMLSAIIVALGGLWPQIALTAETVSGTPVAPEAAISKKVEFKDSKGNEIGNATLTQTDNGVLIHVELHNMTPGTHGFHIHEKGDCTLPSFGGAGDHLNPDNHPHGFMHENGPHDGDLPNLYVEDSGIVRADFLTTAVTLNANDTSKRAPLLDDDGSALIVHAAGDDYTAQPSGNSGDRIACAPITRQ